MRLHYIEKRRKKSRVYSIWKSTTYIPEEKVTPCLYWHFPSIYSPEYSIFLSPLPHPSAASVKSSIFQKRLNPALHLQHLAESPFPWLKRLDLTQHDAVRSDAESLTYAARAFYWVLFSILETRSYDRTGLTQTHNLPASNH